MPTNLLESLYDRLLSRLGLSVLAVAFGLNLAALFVAERSSEMLERAREWALHSRDVITEIERSRTRLLTVESLQRGYLYAADPAYLDGFARSAADLNAGLDGLREMVSDSAARAASVQRLAAIALDRVAELHKSIAAARAGRADAARAIALSPLARQLAENFDAEVAQLLAEEERLRKERTGIQEAIQFRIRWGFALVLVTNALLLLAGAYTIVRDLRRRHATMADLATRKQELEAMVSQRTDELRELSNYLQRVREEEKRSVARELHDEMGGTLSAVKIDVAMARDAALKAHDAKSAARLERALAALDEAIAFKRRLIEDLRPTLLDNIGFEAALRWQCEQFTKRTGCPCDTRLPDVPLGLAPDQAIAWYRIVQEALTNVLKYAQARRVSIDIDRDGDFWRLTLRDDGIGLDPAKQHHATSHGLVGMRERMAALGGTFAVTGQAGQGTTLTARLPIGPPAPV